MYIYGSPLSDVINITVWRGMSGCKNLNEIIKKNNFFSVKIDENHENYGVSDVDEN